MTWAQDILMSDLLNKEDKCKVISIMHAIWGSRNKWVHEKETYDPVQAIKYVRRIEELIGAPVALLSTSPERNDTILMHNPFED